ncbi:hypothetical protein BDF19DRAFT_450051 [Syncephalis fuscata]|nr:hypothetical protein BDF19DRAFT_450051 [Syncephalis fuscata]
MNTNTVTNFPAPHLLWGFIDLNPKGEVSTWEFLLQHTNREDAQQRAFSCYIQGFINTIFLVVFVRNTWHASKLIYYKHTSSASWCCFLQAFMGLIVEGINVLAILPGAVPCRLTIWMSSLGMVVSSICVSICLLIRAYIIADRSRVLLVPSTNTVEFACIVTFPSYFPWYRFVLDITINCIFSIIFLRVIIAQYRKVGSDCWKKLKVDGVVYLFGVVLSNIFCAIVTAFKLAGDLSEMTFLFDWVLTSSLLIHQHASMRRAFDSYGPDTQQKHVHYMNRSLNKFR